MSEQKKQIKACSCHLYKKRNIVRLIPTVKQNYRKDSCISRTFLLKFWAKNHGWGLYTRPFLSERVNWLVVVIN